MRFILLTALLFSAGEKKPEQVMEERIYEVKRDFKHMSRPYAKKLSREIYTTVRKKQNSWIHPYILLGLAINESDLRWWLTTGYMGNRDCGICQNHVALFRDTYWKRIILCKELMKSSALSFDYAMKELNSIRRLWCTNRYKKPQQGGLSKDEYSRRIVKWNLNRLRCLLNLYNQGPRYFSRQKCNFARKKKETPKEYSYRVKRCYYRNRYWIRSLCFTVAAMTGNRTHMFCRLVTSVNSIKKQFKIHDLRTLMGW